MPVSVTTRGYDHARSGANIAETVLTPAAVRARGIKQALVLKIPDDPRLDSQPLYLAGLEAGGRRRNVVIQATMANWVHAFDADTGEALWHRQLGPAVNSTRAIDMHLTNKQWGVLSTPVADVRAGRLYACCWTSEDGDWAKARHKVAAIDLATGDLTQPLLDLHGVTSGALTFDSTERKQRAALTLLDGPTLLIPFGTVAEDEKSAHGWLIAIDIASWSVGATWSSTSRGSGGGIWMSGAGPAIQRDGTIWIVTGNGDFDAAHDFGESIVKLAYHPPLDGAAGRFEVKGWWAPYTDDGRMGGNPGGEAVRAVLPQRQPSNFRVGPHLARLGMAQFDDAWKDQDLGASGIILIEELGVALASGKDGILYTVRLDRPGDTTPGSLDPANVAGNFAKLAAAPILYTYFDPAVPPAPANSSVLNLYSADRTHHLHGTPVAWKSAAHGWMHFCGGENGNLRAWRIGADRTSVFLANSEAWASPLSNAGPGPNAPHGGMPGWSLTLSADGEDGGIIWGMIPYGDANMEITTSRLVAYDASAFGRFADGSGEIVPLWDSQDWNWTILHPKFNRPVVADGKVFVPTYGGELLVLTLA